MGWLRNTFLEAMIDLGIKDRDDFGREYQPYIVGYDGQQIWTGNDVVVGRDDWGYYGIGEVLRIKGWEHLAVVKLYPWLSPGFDDSTMELPGEWLRKDKYRGGGTFHGLD